MDTCCGIFELRKTKLNLKNCQPILQLIAALVRSSNSVFLFYTNLTIFHIWYFCLKEDDDSLQLVQNNNVSPIFAFKFIKIWADLFSNKKENEEFQNLKERITDSQKYF